MLPFCICSYGLDQSFHGWWVRFYTGAPNIPTRGGVPSFTLVDSYTTVGRQLIFPATGILQIATGVALGPDGVALTFSDHSTGIGNTFGALIGAWLRPSKGTLIMSCSQAVAFRCHSHFPQRKSVTAMRAKAGTCQNKAWRSAVPVGWSGNPASSRENARLKSP
jgi:hypothetical protein